MVKATMQYEKLCLVGNSDIAFVIFIISQITLLFERFHSHNAPLFNLNGAYLQAMCQPLKNSIPSIEVLLKGITSFFEREKKYPSNGSIVSPFLKDFH